MAKISLVSWWSSSCVCYHLLSQYCVLREKKEPPTLNRGIRNGPSRYILQRSLSQTFRTRLTSFPVITLSFVFNYNHINCGYADSRVLDGRRGRRPSGIKSFIAICKCGSYNSWANLISDDPCVVFTNANVACGAENSKQKVFNGFHFRTHPVNQ